MPPPHPDRPDPPKAPGHDAVHAAWEAARSRHHAPPDFADRVMESLRPQRARPARGAPAEFMTRTLAHPIGRAALIAVAVTACAFRVAQVMRLLFA